MWRSRLATAFSTKGLLPFVDDDNVDHTCLSARSSLTCTKRIRPDSLTYATERTTVTEAMATFQDAQMPSLNSPAPPNLAALAELRNQGDQTTALMWQKHLLEKLWGLSGSSQDTTFSRMSTELPNSRQGKTGSMNFRSSEIQSGHKKEVAI